MRQFKARVEIYPPTSSTLLHAMEMWFQSDNIVTAAAFVHDVILPIGFEDSHVTKLIDITTERD